MSPSSLVRKYEALNEATQQYVDRVIDRLHAMPERRRPTLGDIRAAVRASERAAIAQRLRAHVAEVRAEIARARQLTAQSQQMICAGLTRHVPAPAVPRPRLVVSNRGA